ncbi:hypothetical protein HPB50_009502 [Hyalomma asiaticum]|uniref:Uncharacterized protein n=1 Tax=Hyalomma asiaticum TaxID=266040 RepID=A0ACB7RIC9_HYAAI|nr:hypothetical protein HPB50_009502 [Hyalomma asiaticum]
MPDTVQAGGQYYRFRGHQVAGINWRPTRLVDKMPDARVCCVCRTIPKRTVLLPCLHALCECCQARCRQVCGALCPVDREPFVEVECVAIDFPARKANTVMVYCWNETRGCEFIGTAESMLRHYENECTFHAAECSVCGESVLHTDLPAHYASGSCSDTTPSAATEQETPAPTELTFQDLNAAMEELKALLSNSNQDQLLPSIQSQMNELAEHISNQEALLARIAHEIRASEPNLRRGGCRSTEVVARCEQVISRDDSLLRLTGKPSTSRRWVFESMSVTYLLTLDNAKKVLAAWNELEKFAEVTVPLMKDTRMVVAVWKRWHLLQIEVKLDGLQVGSRCVPLLRSVTALHPHAASKNMTLDRERGWECSCERGQGLLEHRHLSFCADSDLLNACGFVREGKIMFMILLFG